MVLDDDWDLRGTTAALPVAPAGRETCIDIWLQLISHRLEVVLNFTTEQREYLVLRERRAGPPPLSGRNLAIFERFLRGVGRKVISYELGLSQSAVAQVLKTALLDMGLHCSPARAPSLLVVLAHAAWGTATHAELSTAHFEHEHVRYCVLSESFEKPFLRRLAPAERAVVRQLIGGSSYGDIAARRQTSYRTVANQVAAACHRLGVSGRFDLLQLIATFADRQGVVQRA